MPERAARSGRLWPARASALEAMWRASAADRGPPERPAARVAGVALPQCPNLEGMEATMPPAKTAAVPAMWLSAIIRS